MKEFRPPPLNRRITLRTIGRQEVNPYGRPISEAHDDVEEWAHRYDRRVAHVDGREAGGATLKRIFSTFTIRARDDINERTVVIDQWVRFVLTGPPLERGGDGFGRAERWLELDCRRSA